ncbi:MAG: thioesterase family protein [Pseudomonadota bacterium]
MTTAGPLDQHRERLRPEWIDYNGHLNVAYYLLVFDHATDTFFDHVGLDRAYRAESNCSTFAVETHVSYLRELQPDSEVRVTTQLLGFDEKRLHFFHNMYHAEEGFLSATNECLSLHVDMARRRVGPMPATLLARLGEVMTDHSDLAIPEQAGRAIALKRPKTA